MRQERGITLTSLVVYVIGLIVVIGMISTFSGYFFGHTDEIISKNTAEEEYTRFLSYLTKDINSKDLTKVELLDSEEGTETLGNDISFTFSNGDRHEYWFVNEKIYYKQSKEETVEKFIALCSQVSSDGRIFKTNGSQVEFDFYIDEQEFTNTFYTYLTNKD